MKLKFILGLFLSSSLFGLVSCSKDNTSESDQSEAVERLIDQDEQKADSMKKALGIE